LIPYFLTADDDTEHKEQVYYRICLDEHAELVFAWATTLNLVNMLAMFGLSISPSN
jgi:hypothetical protein